MGKTEGYKVVERRAWSTNLVNVATYVKCKLIRGSATHNGALLLAYALRLWPN